MRNGNTESGVWEPPALRPSRSILVCPRCARGYTWLWRDGYFTCWGRGCTGELPNSSRLRLDPVAVGRGIPVSRVRTATHESGHALVAGTLLGSSVVKLVTIEEVSRKATAGHVSLRPGWGRCEDPTYIAIMLAGPAAESLAFGDYDPEGAMADLQRARRVSGNHAELDRAWALVLELLDEHW